MFFQFFSIIQLLASYSHLLKPMLFHLSLSASKTPQIPMTLLSILADFNSAVVWMILILTLTSNSSNLFSRPLKTVPRAPTTIGIVTFVLHGFFNS